jgi:hypothetical protein
MRDQYFLNARTAGLKFDPGDGEERATAEGEVIGNATPHFPYLLKCLSAPFNKGGMSMKRLAAMGLVCLLSACQSSPETYLSGQPAKAANFPAMAADLSDCVYRFSQSMRSAYLFHRIHVREDKEFLVIAKGSNAPTQPKHPQPNYASSPRARSPRLSCVIRTSGTTSWRTRSGPLLDAAHNRGLSRRHSASRLCFGSLAAAILHEFIDVRK